MRVERGKHQVDLLGGKAVLAVSVLDISFPRTEVILLSVWVYITCDIEIDVAHINKRSTEVCGLNKCVHQVRWYLSLGNQMRS